MLLIQWTNGDTDQADDFATALSIIQEQYPEAVAYDLGGISMQSQEEVFGKILVWQDEGSRDNEDTDVIAEILTEE